MWLWKPLSMNFHCQLSACAVTLAAAGGLLQVGSLVIGWRTGVTVGTLAHLLTDGVHQVVKNLLHVDVVFGTGLQELEAWRGQREKEEFSVIINWCFGSCRACDKKLCVCVCWPSSVASLWASAVGTCLSSSKSTLLPTSTTWALPHEYVLICVALGNTNTTMSQPLHCCVSILHYFILLHRYISEANIALFIALHWYELTDYFINHYISYKTRSAYIIWCAVID